MNTIWLCALLIIIGVAYLWGYENGKEQELSAEARISLERYKIDKYFDCELKKIAMDKYNELERWKEERRKGHDVPAP